MRHQRTGALAIAVALIAVAGPTWGAGGADEAAGTALFDEAKRLMDAGDYANACPKIVAAHKLSPTPGKLLRLGDCYERGGKPASAWGSFRAAETAARNAGDADRQAEGARRAGLLEPRLSRLTIEVAPGAARPGLVITRDGNEDPEAMWSSGIPVDPGTHTVEAKRPHKKPWRGAVTIDRPGGTTIKVPELEDAPEGGDAGSDDGSMQRTAGFAMLGVGGAALVLGAITLAVDKAKQSSLIAQCPGGTCPLALEPTLRGEVSTYHILGVVSTSSLAGGGALAVTGLIVALVAPKAQPVKTGFMPLIGPGFVGVSGRFQ